ncbi:MAG: hypothetical protein V7K25_30850 [Nostoc sp.]|uniref:hypothetical protein n=1 Tax=Nostoc sp. TaxID=1180 RepID=UPI002FF53DE3
MFYKQLKRNLVVGIIVVSSLITSSPGLSQIQPNSNKWVVLSKDVSYRKVELNWNSIEFEPNHLSAGFTYKVAKRSGMAFVDCGNNSARVYYALVEGYGKRFINNGRGTWRTPNNTSEKKMIDYVCGEAVSQRNKLINELLNSSDCTSIRQVLVSTPGILNHGIPIKLYSKARKFDKNNNGYACEPGEEADISQQQINTETSAKVNIGCVPKNNQSRILSTPNPNDIHPNWRGESYIGTSWSLIIKEIIKNNTIIYLKGDLYSPRGGLINENVFVLENEWDCSPN